MKIIFLSGSGGTGKTSVLKPICDKIGTYANGEARVETVPSPTRRAYSQANIANEQVALKDSDEEKEKLQDFIFSTYLDNLSTEVEKAHRNGVHFLLVDRSPFDYCAYQYTILPKLSVSKIKANVSTADEFLRSLSSAHTLFFFLFPYPAPWGDLGYDDGYRDVAPAKNFVWNSTIQALTYGLQGSAIQRPEFPKYVAMVNQTSIEDRVDFIANSIGML